MQVSKYLGENRTSLRVIPVASIYMNLVFKVIHKKGMKPLFHETAMK